MNGVRSWPTRLALLGVTATLGAGPAVAANAADAPAKSAVASAGPNASGAAAAAPADPEESLDEGLKAFGYLTGLARGCVVPEQRTKLEREALDLSAAIARLFGTDRAFLYAAGFGYGTSIVVEVDQCREVLAQYDARVAKFRADGRSSQ